MNYNIIYNPVTKEYHNLFSNSGLKILKNYLKNYIGGSHKGEDISRKNLLLMRNDDIINSETLDDKRIVRMSPAYFDILNNKFKNFLDTYIIDNSKNICSSSFGIGTRSSIKYGSVSCRIWQLFYILIIFLDIRKNEFIKNIFIEFHKNSKLVSYNPLENSVIQKYLFFMCYIFEYINSRYSRRNYLASHIKNCHIPNENGSGETYFEINSIKDLLQIPGYPYKVYPLFMYNSRYFSHPGEKSSIVHYFTIINFRDKLYLNSSWGSDNVKIKQSTIEIHPPEFNEYCRILNIYPRTEEMNKYIINFNKKYFFSISMALELRYDEDVVDDNPELYHEWIKPEDGIRDENVNYLLNNTFKICLYKKYIPMVQKFIDILENTY